jgi:transcription initiation factor TFIIIB Brf1 subunit/transcription initiation factor TFIIB
MVPWQEKLRKGEKKSSVIMTAPTTQSRALVDGNGPDSPPVLFTKNNTSNFYDDADERCHNCHSTDLFTDWKQGDRICRSCGVVAEEKMRDDRPEWKDFNDAEDIVKRGCTSIGNSARSGLVPVDETKYLGGLQPTTLSKQPFGGPTGAKGGFGLARIQKRLRATNRKLDSLMERAHKRELNNAKLERKIRLKNGEKNSSGRELEYERYILQEEEDMNRKHEALYADKWSLDRAILLHGSAHDHHTCESFENEDQEDLRKRLDPTLKKAAKDLFTAYSMMTKAAQNLNLPDRLTNEIVHRLVRYVTRRDGFVVKGVSNRLSKTSGAQTSIEKKKATERLREYNKLRQIGSLNAALIYLTSKSMGYSRSIAQICQCFQYDLEWIKQKSAIKPKHCSRAMNEIKATFPEYASISPLLQSSSDAHNHHDSFSAVKFADHFLQPLQLPPVAEASIKTLLFHCREEQVQHGRNSGTKLPTLCAALTLFVCSTGSTMQRLAQQVQPQQEIQDHDEKRPANVNLEDSGKRRKLNSKQLMADLESFDSDSDSSAHLLQEANDDAPFDVFSHAPIVEDRSEKQEYEMRRMWDAWREQMPWSRSAIEIEQACAISRDKVSDFHESNLYPRREDLLNVLKERAEPNIKKEDGSSLSSSNEYNKVLQDTPLATTLLGYITTAAALMTCK